MKKQTISAALSVAALLAAGIALAVPVKVSSFGYNPTDATECLQKALDSGERQLVVDRQDGGWNVRPLKLTKGNVEIVLEPGVVIRAKKGEFVDGYDTLLSVEGATNVVIRGAEGSGIAMNKADYADRSRYAFSTHRHALAPFVRRMWTNVLCGCRKQCMANRCFPAWGWGGFAVMMSGWVLSWTRFTWFAPFQRYPLCRCGSGSL